MLEFFVQYCAISLKGVVGYVDHFLQNVVQSLAMKKFGKSSNIWRSC